MRHSNANRKFGRETDERRALLKSLAGNLIVHEKIKTTGTKAKELKSFIEKLVTKAKAGDLASRRLVLSRLGVSSYAKKLVEKIAPRYKDRRGGYTRVVKIGQRQGDGSMMAIIEFV